MDVVLIDRRRSFRAEIAAGLASGDRLVEINEHWLASGRWLPNAAATRTVLLAVHRADANLLRALHRLWAAEHAPACYLVSAAGSEGERALQALLGAPLAPRASTSTARSSAALRWRAVASLGLSQLLALERLAASHESYQNE